MRNKIGNFASINKIFLKIIIFFIKKRINNKMQIWIISQILLKI